MLPEIGWTNITPKECCCSSLMGFSDLVSKCVLADPITSRQLWVCGFLALQCIFTCPEWPQVIKPQCANVLSWICVISVCKVQMCCCFNLAGANFNHQKKLHWKRRVLPVSGQQSSLLLAHWTIQTTDACIGITKFSYKVVVFQLIYIFVSYLVLF